MNTQTTFSDKVHTQDAYSELAQIFKASGDAMRLEILRILERDAYGVLELAAIFDVGQSAMSHHLKVLAKAGLVETQREGNSIFYRRPVLLGETPTDTARLNLLESVDLLSITDTTQTGIAQVREQRALQSQAFFARNAEHFKAHQELIAEYGLYSKPARELLENVQQSEMSVVLEIGPGEGAFLQDLSEMFNQVIALDNSSEMLEQARQLAQTQGLDNIEFLLGTTTDALQRNIKVDAIVINMVLHHVPSPASLISDCTQLLNSGGVLVISELSRHNQTWARESCGDLWLGFDSKEISQWADEAGLQEGESLYIGVRNGFQIQVRQFALPDLNQETLAAVDLLPDANTVGS
ncbi:ArsR family transcriptional regulator [Hahella sp. CCB-MM4]|uniref:ArsR/SmtB family transcription factor n=1 Tax=Hahella sp. (strain CCB-MM4) TaxID=1926491 RepID=UPI000B9B5C28|nr:metalloregulator ArsR/SmtB family transcription factor [Hahella sp. CCB-MM4]OZG69951.1 ArsR family transcriptional regulator [Hahella sp. CCB-MM4]